MHKTFRFCFLSSCSDNRKSKIKKRPRRPKWVGLFAIVTTFVALAGGVESQQPTKVSRIGYLSSRDPAGAGESTRSEAIRLALRERGYIEGQNIITEYRYAE